MPDPRKQSLDEIVTHSAIVLADQIQKAAAWAQSEMDLQVEVAGALKQFARRAQITLEGHHNVTIATGRPDSVYGSVILEYKDPNTLSPTKDAVPNQRLIEQLKKRFYDMRREEKRQWSSMFGVGTDGKYFVFLRFRDDKWTDQEPLEVNRYSTERFLWALYNLGQKGKPYQPEYLHGDFGSDSRIAQEGVGTLYDEILKTENPRAQVFFSQWKILFGEVCGYDVENLTDKLKKLAEFYGVKGRPHPAQLLFALHTYFALLIKLLAAEVVSFFNPWMPRQVEKLQNATTSPKLRRELDQLERGGIFRDMGITNFLEGDLFSWYLAVWSEPIETLTRKMISKLDEYNPGTFSEDPAQSRDLLKKLYQQLFPKSVRHDLGEYYTPDWLAEHVLNELGYEGDPDKRLLDPACGSGTFLVLAINRIRRWYDANREECVYDEGGLLKKILSNVIGFDLNPLAVMAARANYLVAIKDLVRHVDSVEIPVYLCDSIMTPAEYGDLFTGAGHVAKVPCSAMKPPHLLVPKEIARSPKEMAKYAGVLENCVKNGYTPQEFLTRCSDEGLKITAAEAHIDLYEELVGLDKDNKNGIWARIIKNNFAPLFVGRVDYVAGNPPWVLWDNLPSEFREELRGLMTTRYGLMAEGRSTFGRLGQAKKDLSMLFFYSSLDRYSKHSGRLGFVITQTLFQTTAANEFRAFVLPEKNPISVYRVEDWVAVQPFRPMAGNKTATVFAEKGKPTSYPIPYVVWTVTREFERESADWSVVSDSCQRTAKWAHLSDPGDKCSFWTVGSKLQSGHGEQLTPMALPKPRAGINTSLESAYKVEIVGVPSKGHVLLRNVIKGAKKPVPVRELVLEDGLVLPFMSGESLKRWVAKPAGYYIVPHTAETGMHPLGPSSMKREYHMTYSYLLGLRPYLEGRSLHKRWGGSNPFYALYNIGPYTFAPFRLCWQRTTTKFGCAVVSTFDTQELGKRILVPNGDIMFLPFEQAEAAHYVCALLNSSPARLRINRSITTKAHKDIIGVVTIPAKLELKKEGDVLVDLAMECHSRALRDRPQDLADLEARVDRIAAKLWGIADDELRAIQEALGETGKQRQREPEGEEND